MKNQRVIVGLGNIGPEFKGTRHNVGFDAADFLAEKLGCSFIQNKIVNGYVSSCIVESIDVFIIKPMTFMNSSGKCVKKFINKFCGPNFELSSLIVIHDDTETAIGNVRTKFAVSARGHNGVKNIQQELNSMNFFSLKIGVGRPSDKNKMYDFVLEKFPEDEHKIIEESINSSYFIISEWLNL